MCKAGVHSESMEKRINKLGIEDWRYRVFPTRFWDIYGEYGHPVRTTVSEMGPMLLSRLMDLSDVQSDVLNLVFKIADDKGLLLIDIKDLKAMLTLRWRKPGGVFRGIRKHERAEPGRDTKKPYNA